MADVWANSMHVIPETHSHLPHCRVLPLGEFNGMSSHSHISHCRVLPLGEFTVMIPEPYATLQGPVTWRNQCHDRATLQGVIIPSAILNIVFLPYFIYFWFFKRSLGFEERQLSYRFWYICFNKKFSCRRELEYFAKSFKIIRNETVE